MKQIIYTFLICSCLIQACSPPTPIITQNDIPYNNCYLTKVFQNESLLEEYIFDERWRVKDVYNYNTSDVDHRETRSYNQNDQLIQQTFRDRFNFLIFYSTFEYFLPDSIVRYNYLPGDSLERYDVYHFDETQSCPLLGRYTYDANTNDLLYYYTATTLDSNCSVLLTDYDELGNRTTRNRYWVNEDRSPYVHVMFPFLKMYNTNALEKVEALDANGNVMIGTGSYQSSFTVNASNYPIYEFRSYLGGSRLSYDYEYSCE